MNAFRVAAVVAALVAVAVICAAHALRPATRNIAQVRRVLQAGVDSGRAERATRGAGWTQWIGASSFAESVDRRLGRDLELIGLTTADLLSRIVAGFVVGSMTTLLTTSSLVALGLLPLTPVWLVAAPVVGAMAAFVLYGDATGRIERHRREFRRTTNDFVQLVAVGLTTDQSVEEAIRFALGVGDSEAFHVLRAELSTAPQRGVALWDALDRLGHRYGQRELSEFGSSIERQGLQGVSITDTVSTLAASMRARALDQLERDADKANANLAGPTICFVVTTVVFIAYPLALRISEAFSG